MADGIALTLLIAGALLFFVGDFLWLVQVTLGRPMNLRRTGVLVLSGVLLIALGLLRVATS